MVELGEDPRVGLAEDVGQDVEAAAVGHADEHLARAGRGGGGDQLVEHRDQHVDPLDREALLPLEGGVQEALEAFHLRQPLEQRAPLLGRQGRAEGAVLGDAVQPGALGEVLDVVVVVADGAGVDLAQAVDRVEAGARLRAGGGPDDGGRQRGERGGVDAMRGRVEHRVAGRGRAERVDPGGEVAELADAARQVRHSGSLRHPLLRPL